MEISEDQIRRFLANECHNAEEADEIAAYLEAYPHMLKRWMPDGELLKEQALNQGQMAVPSAEMLRAIRRRTYGGVNRFWIGTAAAAALAGLIIGGVVLFGNINHRTVATPEVNSGMDQTKAAAWKTIQNITASSTRLTMEDGSEIVLEPGTVLEYQAPFASNRHLRLKGIAYFKVTRDSKHPFSVVADGYVTKVLGTSFRIWAMPDNKDVRVALYTGKVGVEQGGANGHTFSPVILSPGQQVIIDKITRLAKLTSIQGVPSQMAAPLTSNSVTADGNLIFHQASLSRVFRQLEQRYGIIITFSPKQTDHLDFTGTIYKEDDINIIMKNLSGLNNLTLLKNDTGFTIKK